MSEELLNKKPTYEELAEAIDQFTCDREITDINMLPLFRVDVRLNRESIKRCPDCTEDCDEPCNTDAEEVWARLDDVEKKLNCPKYDPEKCFYPCVEDKTTCIHMGEKKSE